ncbi:MAG: YdaS family helix-turn-helix protein [Burkholderia sp.]
MTIIKKAVKRAGGAAAVAASMGLSRISVYEWMTKDRVPDPRVLALAELTEWEVTPHQIAPSLYPNPSDGLPVNVLGTT